MKKQIFSFIAICLFFMSCAGPAKITSFEKKQDQLKNEKILDQLKNEGIDASKKGEHQQAISKFSEGLKLAKEAENKRYEGIFLGNIGFMYQKLGQNEKALLFYDKTLHIHSEIGYHKGIIMGLEKTGNIYQISGQFEKALSFYERALIEIKDNDDIEKNISNILTNMGRIYVEFGQFDKALSYFKQAEPAFSKSNNRIGEGENLANIGDMYAKLAQHEKAISFFEKALSIFKEIGERKNEALVLISIGFSNQFLGNYQKAFLLYGNALTIQTEINDLSGKFLSLKNFGILFFKIQKYKEALSFFEKALPISREINNRQGETECIGLIANLYMLLCQYENAQSYYEKSLSIARETGNRTTEAAILADVGTLKRLLGQYEQSLGYHYKSFFIATEIGNRYLAAMNSGQIGLNYFALNIDMRLVFYFLNWALATASEIGAQDIEKNLFVAAGSASFYSGMYKEASYYYQKAIPLIAKSSDFMVYSELLRNVGLIQIKLTQYEKAKYILEQSLDFSIKLNDLKNGAITLSLIGNCYNLQKKYNLALQNLNQAVKIQMKIKDFASIGMSRYYMAKAELNLNKFDLAVSHFEQAFDSVETIRSTLKYSKQSFMKNKIADYEEFITLLQKLHKKAPSKRYDHKAFNFFERKQSRIFLEEIGESTSKNFTGFPEALRKKESSISHQLLKMKSNLHEEQVKSKKDINIDYIRQLEESIALLQSDQTKLEQHIKVQYPDYYALKYPKPVALNILQNIVLQPDETLLVYGVMNEKTCLWVIRKNDFLMHTIHITEVELSKKIKYFRKGPKEIKKTSGQQLYERKRRYIYSKTLEIMNKNGEELYDILIPTKIRQLIQDTKKLYIIPTGPLYSLPFESLCSKSKNLDYPIKYLIEHCSINYLSSASLLKILRDARSRKKEIPEYPLIAFANPVYKVKSKTNLSETENITAISQNKSFNELRHRSYRSIMKDGFHPLPDTEVEARAIAHVLSAPPKSTPLQLQMDASRSNLLLLNEQEKLDDYKYILFACHGVVPGKTNQILQPSLVLSLPDPISQKNEYLTMADVFGLKLNADLISLSACDTGRGKLIRGEGIMGLTRAFMYAGTSSISVTLWPVDTKSAKIMSVGLFERLKSGKPCGDALREMKLRMIRGEEGEIYRHPFYWAPLVIFGLNGTDVSPAIKVANTALPKKSLCPGFNSKKNEEDLLITLNHWSKTWSSRKIDKYLSCYSSNFKPEKGLSIKKWKFQRKKRLTKQFINISTDKPRVQFLSCNKATIEFRQYYLSNTYQDVSDKQLVFEKIDGQWLITREQEK
jgi:CHAT domain-containing protein/Tfp pilus assembly protein PilF